jgi:hypothetical protein
MIVEWQGKKGESEDHEKDKTHPHLASNLWYKFYDKIMLSLNGLGGGGGGGGGCQHQVHYYDLWEGVEFSFQHCR